MELQEELNNRVVPNVGFSETGRGVFSHPQVTKFRGGTPKKGTTPKLKVKKLTDIVKQIVYILF